MSEARQVLTYPSNIWTTEQFWKMAQKISHDIIISMGGHGHPLPAAMKSGAIDSSAAAKSIIQSVIANITAEAFAAGNA